VGSAAKALWFTAPRRAELRTEEVADPAPGQVTVRGIASLVSAGTEMLVYRGDIPAEDDLGLETCAGSFGFPVKYAYQIMGEVEAAGADAPFSVGDRVFARHPHQERFTMRVDPTLIFRVPDGLAPERTIFANLLDVALNCNLDVPVRHGDCVVVYGQGIVGSLCAQLARRTAGRLVVVDPAPRRRELALSWGADAAVEPGEALEAVLELSGGRGADVSIEASGSPAALQSAIVGTGQEGTVVAVSFFGARIVPLVLSPEFHYRRQRIVSSQVSSLGTGLQPRWSLERRMATVFDVLADERLQTPISHTLPFAQAPEAYELLDASAETTMGIVLTYE
jgi:2-desacetyl-2-hydroxyethyl bacteriochlorophyllide A dehydrogenase